MKYWNAGRGKKEETIVKNLEGLGKRVVKHVQKGWEALSKVKSMTLIIKSTSMIDKSTSLFDKTTSMIALLGPCLVVKLNIKENLLKPVSVL